MVQKFQAHFEAHFSYLKNKTILLALSGGVDSCVLLDLCLAVAIRPVIVHCNFQLRGEASDQDAQWVTQISKEKGLRCIVQNFDTKAYAKQQKISTQMAARELRYHWFDRLCSEENFAAVLIAHHKNDAVETFLINALRGSGLKGLIGIPETREKIIRPLLPFSKETILAYAQEKSIPWREDVSNATTDYLRNALRHEVIPKLIHLQPQAINSIQTALDHLSGANAFIEHAIGTLKKQLFTNDNDTIRIPIADLKQLNPLDFCLHELFFPYGFSALEIEKLLDAIPGKIVRSSTHRLLCDRDFFILTTLKKEEEEVYKIDLNQPNQSLPIFLHWDTVLDLPNKKWEDHEAALDKKLLKNPLLLRKSKQGDYFYPSGMKGKKLLSKYYKDEKYSLIDKENQWVLCSDSAIVWVVGKRCDRRFTATEKTAETLVIHCNL